MQTRKVEQILEKVDLQKCPQQEPVLNKKVTGSLKGEPRVAHHTTP